MYRFLDNAIKKMKGFNDFEVIFNTDVELEHEKGEHTHVRQNVYVIYLACVDYVAGRKTKENCRQRSYNRSVTPAG